MFNLTKRIQVTLTSDSDAELERALIDLKHYLYFSAPTLLTTQCEIIAAPTEMPYLYGTAQLTEE